MSVISLLNKALAVPGLCWGFWGGKAIGIYAHAPFFWPPQLTKEQTATSTAHFPKSPTVWRNLHHGLQQHVLATGLLWPHNLLEVGWLKVTHSYPLHHKPKALTESGSAHTEWTHRSCWNGVTNSGLGPTSWDEFHILPWLLQAAVTFPNHTCKQHKL